MVLSTQDPQLHQPATLTEVLAHYITNAPTYQQTLTAEKEGQVEVGSLNNN